MNNYEMKNCFLELGYDAIPLLPGSKKPLLAGWQYTNPQDQWNNADANSNIGIRAGGNNNLAIFDLDEKITPGVVTKVKAYLYGLGVLSGSYPEIQTASGNGRHFWISLDGKTMGKNLIQLKDDVGVGDLRINNGSMVVAPNSLVIKTRYKLISGNYSILPKVDFRDLRSLLNFRLSTYDEKVGDFKLPKSILQMTNGIGVERYKSRSEFEQAIITGLIQRGLDFDSVIEIFRNYPCGGKFYEINLSDPKAARKYLFRSYTSGVNYIRQSKENYTRKMKIILDWVNSEKWWREGNLSDQAVLLAHLEISKRLASFVFSASIRDLANRSGMTMGTVANVNKRLIDHGFLVLVRGSVANYANEFTLGDKLRQIFTPLCE